jgi:hypothetical protein
MATLPEKISAFLGRAVDFPSEVSVVDRGDGPSIEAWNVVGVAQPTQDQLDAAEPAADAARAAVPMRLLRLERDKRLAATDWLSLPDSPAMSGDETAYRQQLRDLPANTEDPDNVTWPTAP